MDGHSSGTPVAERLARPTRAATRKHRCRLPGVPPLFGLAPGGVCRAASVAGRAVGSYPTVSPLPARRTGQAVCFLWHFPWGRPRRMLSGTVFPWSPDFPHPQPFGSRWCGRPAGWQGDKGVCCRKRNLNCWTVILFGKDQAKQKDGAPSRCHRDGTGTSSPSGHQPDAALPSSNRPPKPGSCASRHGRHCSAGSCRRWCRPTADEQGRDISCRI
jgi:hypothetical protein